MAYSNSNLDLLDISSDDHDQLASRIDQFYTGDTSIKNQLGWAWERNHLMLDGKQWLVFYGDRNAGGIWQRASISKQNEYIPRPVTNYLFSIYQTLKSYLIKEKPRISVTPNTQTNKDKVAAKLANLVAETNWIRLNEQYNYESAAAALLVYGTVFKKSYWDTSTVSMVKVPKMEVMPITDPLTGAIVGHDERPAFDPVTGDPLFEELPLGDVNTSVVDPYRICLDPLAMHLHEAKWIMEYSILSLDQIRQLYGKEEPGYTGAAMEIEEDKQLNSSLRRWYQLRTSTGQRYLASVGGGTGNGTSDQMVENSAVVKEYYERPSSKYPKGRLIVSAGGKILYVGESPYEGPEAGDWHPYSECRWEIVPGRFYGRSPLDDAVEIQKHINTIDSTIILTRKTTAFPKVLLPLGCGISPGEWTGRPGQMHFYRDQGTGAKPEVLPGTGVGNDVFTERQQRIQDIKEITGAIDIMRGDRPPGVNAASALNLLYEVGTGKLFPILDRWKAFVECDQKKQLRIIAKYYKEPRPDFIRSLLSKNQDLSEYEVNQFIGSDLYDNCNVKIEAGSNIPKLQAAKQAMLVELAQMGMLNLMNPTNRVQFQKEMGIAGYDSDVGPDQKRAQWENDLLDNLVHSPMNQPVVLAIDNHALHIEEHTLRMKSPAWMSLPIQIQQAYMAHVQQHEQFQAQAAQAAMYQAQAMGPGAPMQMPSAGGMNPPAGAGPARGKGLSSNLQSAVLGHDIQTPAALGGSR